MSVGDDFRAPFRAHGIPNHIHLEPRSMSSMEQYLHWGTHCFTAVRAFKAKHGLHNQACGEVNFVEVSRSTCRACW